MAEALPQARKQTLIPEAPPEHLRSLYRPIPNRESLNSTHPINQQALDAPKTSRDHIPKSQNLLHRKSPSPKP